MFAAHFLRFGNYGATLTVLLFFPLMFLRHRWVKAVLKIGFIFAAVFWAKITIEMVQFRIATGEPWIRMGVILGMVIFITGATVILWNHKAVQQLYSRHRENASWSTGAFFLTFGLLAIVQLKVSTPMLLPERFINGGGWIAAFALSTYAALIIQKMSHPKGARIWRKRIWLLFAVIFFGQFIVGVLGAERFLMTGELHVPVPGVILAGPIFRGDGFFMPVLLAVTLLLAGPAWCSHLCYFGGFDLLAASRRKRPMAHKKWFWILRIALLVMTVLVAMLLRFAGVSAVIAATVAVVFGIAGIGSMIWVSRKMGTMFHCAAVCPIGMIAVVFGRVSPFRMKFTRGCDGCGACGLTCPTGALEKQHIRHRKVGLNCTLCGDCLSICKTQGLSYSFGPSGAPRVRMIFLVLVISLHAVFMGVARM